MNFPTKAKIALRNLIKNRRRSTTTVASVAIGFLALSLFEGYFTYVYDTLEDQAIVGERLGHLTVTKQDYWDKWSLDPHRYMFDAEQYQQTRQLLEGIDGVTLVSPRLQVDGLVSNGEVSRIYIGEGIRAEDVEALRGERYADLPGRLDPANPGAGVMGRKLADNLHLAEGDNAVLLSATIDGMVNAVDVEVGEVATTGAVGTDDKFMLLPLELARRLVDHPGADRIVVLLDSIDRADQAKDDILAALNAAGLEVEVRDWRELSVYYHQVRGLFDMMYLFISLVVALVVMASVVNTMGMAIAERTREIGTLRALGMRVRTLKSLFVVEGMLLVLVGCVIGVLLSYGIGGLINAAELTYTPPDATAEAELIIKLVFANLFGSLFTLVVLAALASYLPARHAARKSIVGALGHV